MSLSKLASDRWIIDSLNNERVMMTNRLGPGKWTVPLSKVQTNGESVEL